MAAAVSVIEATSSVIVGDNRLGPISGEGVLGPISGEGVFESRAMFEVIGGAAVSVLRRPAA